MASVNDPIRWELFSGYRNDHLHWHLQNPGANTTSYREIYRNIQFWENGLVIKLIQRDIAFYVRGSYSAFGKGQLNQHYYNLTSTDSPIFLAGTRGWASDAMGYLSYTANLTPGRHYQFIVMPLVGYSGHFEKLKRNKVQPAPYLSGNGEEIFSSFPQMLRQTWYGVFIGGNLRIEPNEKLFLNVGYTYHWLRSRFKTAWQDQILQFSGKTLTSTITTLNSLRVNQGGNIGQTGWMQIDYCFSRLWKGGFGAQIHYFSTTYVPLHIKQNGVSLAQTFKLRWTPIDGWIQISRAF